MPSAPRTAYSVWLKDNRDKIQKHNPAISHKEFRKTLRNIWAKVSQDVKEEYIKKSEELSPSEKFCEKNPQTDPNLKLRQLKDNLKTGRLCDKDREAALRASGKPPTPTPYYIWRADNKDTDFNGIKPFHAWQQLSDDIKQEYNIKCKEAKLKFAVEIQAWRDSQPDLQRPRMRPFQLWLQDNRDTITKDHPGLTGKEFNQQANKIWMKISSNVKMEYAKKYEESMLKYIKAVKEQSDAAANTSGE